MDGFAFSGKNFKTLYEKKIDIYINSVKTVVLPLLKKINLIFKRLFHFITLVPFQNLISRELVSFVVILAVLSQTQNIQTVGSKIQSFCVKQHIAE